MKKRRVGKLIALFLGVFVTVFCCTLFEGQSLPVFSETEDGTPLLILSYGDISSTESNKSVVSLDTLKSDIEFLSEAGYVFINSADLIAYKQGLSPFRRKRSGSLLTMALKAYIPWFILCFRRRGLRGMCL